MEETGTRVFNTGDKYHEAKWKQHPRWSLSPKTDGGRFGTPLKNKDPSLLTPNFRVSIKHGTHNRPDSIKLPPWWGALRAGIARTILGKNNSVHRREWSHLQVGVCHIEICGFRECTVRV